MKIQEGHVYKTSNGLIVVVHKLWADGFCTIEFLNDNQGKCSEQTKAIAEWVVEDLGEFQ